MSEIRHVVEEHHKALTKRLAFPNAIDFVLEFLNQLMRGGVQEGEEERWYRGRIGGQVQRVFCRPSTHRKMISKILRKIVDALCPGFTPSSCSDPRHTNAKSSTRPHHLEREVDA